MIHKVQVNSYHHLKKMQAHAGNTKLKNDLAPDNILMSYEANQSVCARKLTLFTTLLPVIHSLRQMVQSGVQLVIESMNYPFNASGNLHLFSNGICRALFPFTNHAPQHLMALLMAR